VTPADIDAPAMQFGMLERFLNCLLGCDFRAIVRS